MSNFTVAKGRLAAALTMTRKSKGIALSGKRSIISWSQGESAEI